MWSASLATQNKILTLDIVCAVAVGTCAIVAIPSKESIWIFIVRYLDVNVFCKTHLLYAMLFSDSLDLRLILFDSNHFD